MQMQAKIILSHSIQTEGNRDHSTMIVWGILISKSGWAEIPIGLRKQNQFLKAQVDRKGPGTGDF